MSCHDRGKIVLSLKRPDVFSWIQVLAWCKDCARYFVVHVLHSVYQWHQAALLFSVQQEVHISTGSLSCLKM